MYSYNSVAVDNACSLTRAVFMPKERDTRKPKGFTFCQYKRKEDAEDAIKGMNGRVSTLLRPVGNLFSCSSCVSWYKHNLFCLSHGCCPVSNRTVATNRSHTMSLYGVGLAQWCTCT